MLDYSDYFTRIVWAPRLEGDDSWRFAAFGSNDTIYYGDLESIFEECGGSAISQCIENDALATASCEDAKVRLEDFFVCDELSHIARR